MLCPKCKINNLHREYRVVTCLFDMACSSLEEAENRYEDCKKFGDIQLKEVLFCNRCNYWTEKNIIEGQ